MIRKFRIPFLALFMAYYLAFFYTSPATAGIVDAVFSDGGSANMTLREMEIQKIQRALENKVVQEKLKAYGLSEAEIKAKLSNLSDNEIHTLASASEKVLAGGDGLGFVIGVLVVIILIIVILKLLNKEIIIR
ncbi:MAG: PA2779 family protein [Proteobacteria bacterium]|nr:PA2779 family protein [Pseudomonadota bacterium]